METITIQSTSKTHIKLLFDLAKQLGDKPFIENVASKSLDSGLKDMKRILSGKRKPKTLDDLLNE